MTREATPPAEFPQGSRKRNLSTKAKEAGDEHVLKKNKTAHASATSAPAILPIRTSAKSLKQQNKGLSKKSAKTNEIEESAIEIDDDDQNGQSNLPENEDDEVTKKVETAEEERSKSQIYSQMRVTYLYIRRAPVESLDLTCLYVFPPTSTY